jgi:4,5-dihydroxyphthalate decarboxylase
MIGTAAMPELSLTIALERYDRHMPLFMGTVASPAGLKLRPLEVGMSAPGRDGVARHERFLRNKEFDFAETSLSSHVIATSRGAPFVGIPVFPRRLFSQNHIFVNRRSGIETPRDLIGKRVLIRSFQTTMSVLALGDLNSEYGVPWKDIRWVVATGEVLPLSEREGIAVERLDPGVDVGGLLIDGSVDAMIYPHPPHAVLAAGDRVRPLFRDRKAEALRYYRKRGYYPIMHLIACQRPIIEGHPWLAQAIMRLWEDAKAQSRDYYDDPGYAQLAFAQSELEAQAAEMGPDPWPSGIKANRTNLEDFIRYSRDQGLIDRPVKVEELFHESTWSS